jgi:hypothetical protein
MYFRARYYNPLTGEFLSRDPLEFVDGFSLYRGYMGVIGMDPWGLLLSWWDDPLDFDKMSRQPSNEMGRWIKGERGNGIFECTKYVFEWNGDKKHCARIPYINGEPNFGEYVYKWTGEVCGQRYAIADIDCSILENIDARRKADFQQANACMKKIDPKWFQPDGWTWHHVNCSATGKGQLVLVPTAIHESFAHCGSFAWWSKVLAAKKAKNTTALSRLSSVRFGCYARKCASVGFKAAPGIGLLFLMPEMTSAGETDGAAGVAAVIGRDIVCADLAEGTFNIVVYPYLEEAGNAYSDWHFDFRSRFQAGRYRAIADTIDGQNMIRVDRIDLPECWKDLYGSPYNPGR